MGRKLLKRVGVYGVTGLLEKRHTTTLNGRNIPSLHPYFTVPQ